MLIYHNFKIYIGKLKISEAAVFKVFTNTKMFNIVSNFLKFDSHLPVLTVIRHSRGLPVWESKSLERILKERIKKDPEIDFKVDIGLPPQPPLSRKELLARLKQEKLNKIDLELEQKARLLTLEVDFDLIKEEWAKSNAPKHIQAAAEHYNVFDDLFGDAYFTPSVVMDIYYPQKNKDLVAPVCRGNVVKPDEAFLQPVVRFSSNPEDFWTLTLVNPDGHFTEPNKEYVHWFVGNIPGGDVSKGEIIWDYLPPFPPRGLGFQRFVFVLYKQEKKVDYSSLKKKSPCLELKDRSFQTLEFYRERQNNLTPAGLSFFQSDWDKTAKKVFHEILNMEEPVFEYDFPPEYHKKQKWFPKREPFDRYLDRYRDPRDLNEEYLVKKLKKLDPLTSPKKAFPYPKAIRLYYKNMPTWLMKKEVYYKLKRGRVSNLEREEYE